MIENKYTVIEEGLPNLPYAMVKENLAMPIPRELIRTLPKGGAQIDYVNVTDLKDLLDQRAGIWSTEIKGPWESGNSLCMVITLVIHCNDRDAKHDGGGSCELNHRGYGDSFTNAYAQAFRRACESHGLGREMWRKEEVEDYNFRKSNPQPTQETRQPESRPAQQQSSGNSAPPARQSPPVSQPPQQTAQSQSSGGDSSGPRATTKQVDWIGNLCQEQGINEQMECLAKFKQNFSEISKANASAWISELLSNAKK